MRYKMESGSRINWDEEKINYLIKRKDEGASDFIVGKELGVSKRSIIRIRKKHSITVDISKRKNTLYEEKEELENMSENEISKLYNGRRYKSLNIKQVIKQSISFKGAKNDL